MFQEHQSYLAQDDNLGPVVVSVKKEHHPGVGKLYRTIVRTKVSTVHELVKCDTAETTEPSVFGLTKVSCPEMASRFLIGFPSKCM